MPRGRDTTTAITSAATVAIDSCTFFPTIAELRRLAARLLVTDAAPTAEEGWAEVVAHIRNSYSAWREPPWSHDLVKRAAVTIDWTSLINEMHDPIARRTARGAFLRVYRALLERATNNLLTSHRARDLLAALPALPPGQSFTDWPAPAEEATG